MTHTLFRKVQSFAPAKIILSGEHSVVFGKPALACAVNRHAGVTIEGRYEKGIVFHLQDIKKTVLSTVSTLRRIKGRVADNFRRFSNGELSIRHVLTSPWEIFQYSLISILEACGIELEQGLHINFHSSIPIGCGMGSSAATAVSFLKGISNYLHLDRGIDWLEKCVFECERFQHGSPSGIDAFLALHGGCISFQKGKAPQPLSLPSTPFWLINTGTPVAKTGECVETVRKQFGQSRIWDEFEHITVLMQHYVEQGTLSHPEFLRLVRENQRLLEKIGVVPPELITFIRALEVEGISAKISGAGSVRGQKGGIIAAFGNKPSAKLCASFGMKSFDVQGEKHGVVVV